MVVTPPQPLSNPRALRTRKSLFDAAAKLFVSQGYEETTMADIAAEAGASRRTAFNHFPNKGDIPMMWVRQIADHAIAEVESLTRDDLVEGVRGYFRVISEAVESQPELSRQMMLGWTAALGPALYESQLLSDVTPFLENAQQNGQIPGTVDIAVAARALSDVLQGAVFRWVREPETVLHERVDTAIALVLAAVTSPR
ncbi:TetR/AcrR family transcriptional regulator [Aeromicrobium sp. Leaf350]|uniref:TetR/AcrR family transcriptional regulator n=1 Tax=Aeromicrobium sp. Leaf350 TaxID=2876565 RepID=UPI001E320FA8|nr:TetR/AcrR family transcriptional regulator [Aeromicrobium sp. Leaf350]